MTRPGLAPLGVRVHVGPLPAHTAALAVAPAVDGAGTVAAALGPRARGYALRLALHALAAPRPAGVPYAGVVGMREDWRTPAAA